MGALDAIHLATAFILGDELSGVVTDGDEVAATATQLQIAIVLPR